MRNCIYYVEGECEKKLIMALREVAPLVCAGKIKVRNVISEIIPGSELLSIKPDTTVIMVCVILMINDIIILTIYIPEPVEDIAYEFPWTEKY